eukprot:TRINITY_DN32414_c0_g1_i3.p1 TRINITY_DN32414_c0_g1~~TRINITY_DN32414_c0_g1_i3.p1  ORF type:complete len:106 (-),score=26.77 TRINITY_DN32414_c0_g1_i3:406-723(-)
MMGSKLSADYQGLTDLYGKLLLGIEKVNSKVREEQDKLQAVDVALRDAGNEANYLREDLDEDLEYILEAAEDADDAFMKLEGRCDKYIEAAQEPKPQGDQNLLTP